MGSVEESDEQLMEQSAQGRPEALAALIERYGDGLFTYLWRMVGNRQRAEELFQEVFLLAWERRRQYDYPRPLRPWLFSLATQVGKQDFRKAGASDEIAMTSSIADDGEPSNEPQGGSETPGTRPPANSPAGPETDDGAEETRRLVLTALGGLPPSQKAAAVLRLWGGLSYAEIASITGDSEEGVRGKMHLALTGMRRFLEPRL